MSSKTRGAASSKTRGAARAQERSAGGVVVREERLREDPGGRAQIAVIVPVRRAPDGSRVLALPKGHIDPGESALMAAEREVREEAGVVTEPLHELGEARYWYRRDGRTISKSVSFYLLRYLEGDIADHDDEVEEARWIGLDEAQEQLSHASEREMVARAAAYLQEAGLEERGLKDR